MDEQIDYRLIGSRVRDERIKYNLTQEKLAENVGISASFMGLLERGDRILSVETLVKLSVALGVSTDSLLEATFDSVKKDSFAIQFSLMMNELTDDQKQMVLDVIRAMLPHFKREQGTATEPERE